MTTDLALVLLLLAAAVAMFVANKPRMDAVALLMIVLLPLTGIITMGEALAGFSDPNIVLIAALFVIGEGLVRTGVARRLGDWLYEKAGSSGTRMLILLMIAVGGLGALMSSTAVVAIFIPVVLRICKNTGTPPSQLMMPLSVAALTSGMLTLVATAPNLVVNAELVRQGLSGFGFFSFTPFGLPILLLAIGYMFFARRWLPAVVDGGQADQRQTSLRHWIDQYKLADREHRVRVLPGSPVIGKRREEFLLRAKGINLLAVERAARFGTELIRPQARTEFQDGDTLLLDIEPGSLDVPAICAQYGVEEVPLGEGGGYYTDQSQELGMVEVILPADSELIGHTIRQARVRRELGLTVIGLRRGGVVLGQDLLNQRLDVGDTLLLIGYWSDIDRLNAATEMMVVLNMPAEFDEVLPAGNRAPQALGVLALVVGLMVSGVVPNVQRRHEQRLPLDQLAKHRADRRHAAVLDRVAAHRRRRSRGRRVDRGRRQCRAAHGSGDAVPDHRAAGPVHFQHRDRRADGAGGAGDREGPGCLALSVRDDRGAGGLRRVHDADFHAGEHAGGRAGKLCVRRFRQGRSAVHDRSDDR